MCLLPPPGPTICLCVNKRKIPALSGADVKYAPKEHVGNWRFVLHLNWAIATPFQPIAALQEFQPGLLGITKKKISQKPRFLFRNPQLHLLVTNRQIKVFIKYFLYSRYFPKHFIYYFKQYI